jgi:thiosulfate dehydrogenase (quinone) large subunit
MMFVFAALGSQAENGEKAWPIHLMHVTEAVLLVVAVVCFLIALFLNRLHVSLKIVVVLVGGVSAGIGSVMPFELAPFFFGSKGEVMMATIALNLVYPVAIALFIFLLMKLTGVNADDFP